MIPFLTGICYLCIMNQSVPEVFYIEREPFLRLMLEKYARLREIEVYTVNGDEAPGYLIADLKPKRLMVDALTFLEMGQKARSEVLDASDIPVIWTGFPDDLEVLAAEIGPLDKVLKKPLEAASLTEQILAFS